MPTTPGQEAADVVASAPAGDARIKSIEISNFRGLKDLSLDGLGMVNLIVGRNNTGKTSLLEAVAISCAGKDLRATSSWFRPSASGSSGIDDRQMISAGEQMGRITAKDSFAEYQTTFWSGTLIRPATLSGTLTLQVDGPYRWTRSSSGDAVHSTAFIPSFQSPAWVTPDYAKVAEFPAFEQLLESILAKVDPRIRSIRLTIEGGAPSLVLDLGLPRRIPITHVGQGIARIIAIFSRIVASEARICLIDEIENGIHYTALPELWRGLRQVASELGVQIFATTHSRECLEAATRVFVEEDPERKHDFAVIQLFRIRDGIAGRVLTEERVAEALDSDIELR